MYVCMYVYFLALARYLDSTEGRLPVSRSTIGGGRGCHTFVPVLGGNGTKIAPLGDLFDQTPGEMS